MRPEPKRSARSPAARTNRAIRPWGPLALVTLLTATSFVVLLTHVASAPVPTVAPSVLSPLPAASAPRAAHPLTASYGTTDCDGMYWSSWYNASYVPSFCYGHDEPTMSYQSTVAGSGANASFSMVLPADSSSFAQGAFYATIWFGGTVYDTASNAGGNQAFLELQFYPASPTYTGAGSGTKDCLPNGAYNPSFAAGTNKWFACAIVWQLANIGGTVYEDAGFAGPIDSGASSAILTMRSGDHVFVNYSGVAQSSTVPWNITVRDSSAGSGGWALLKNGSLVISPYYATSAAGNTLKWGASNPGAIAFAYEIGHAYTVSSCSPGDGACDSYWPTRWSQSGQIQLGLPKMGSPSVASYPSKIVLSSSQGGEYEVNNSVCTAPSTSTSKNCLYPYFIYRAGSYSFDFTTGSVTNTTHDYGNKYQFPATLSGSGQWNANVLAAPWGTVHFVVYPANATVDFSPSGHTSVLALPANRTATLQYVEGLYWLNVSAPGCSRLMTTLYVATGKSYNETVFLPCGANSLVASASAKPTSGVFPLAVTFNGSATGGQAPYNFSWSFGDGASGYGASPSHTYTSPGSYTSTLIVADRGGNGSLATVTVNVTEPSCAGANRTVALGVFQYCHLNKGQQAVFWFNVTKTDWFLNGWVDIYALDGSTTGHQPVFKLGAGMGGTPSLTKAKQKANGPNAFIQLLLNVQSAKKYGGWGTYWVVVKAFNGSGGFCYVAAYGNGSLNSPGCPKSVNLPRSGGLPPPASSGPAPAMHPRSPTATPTQRPAVGPGTHAMSRGPVASGAFGARWSTRPAEIRAATSR